ncbi:MAG: pilus assembly FimT family protein [Lachnospiraceae bacterium]|jgi:prepilin-type N-terminal cleavage/methylation domain-containing protein
MKKNRNGFTLAELLIVAAIIGVLVAISIPIFTSQLEKAREATDAANIRSQYAEVMTEAITEGSNVSGKDLFGAVKLKQKKDQWQSSGLKENLEGVYQDVEGDYPKAGGTAWVEYKDDQAILHYEGGSSGSGSGNTGGGSTGGGSTGGSDSGGNTGGGPGGSSALGSLTEQIEKSKDGDLPESIAEGSTYSIKNGNIYGYKGKVYVALTDKEFNHWYNPNPDNSNLYVLLEINVNTQILDSSSDRNNGIKTGSLYKKDDGSVWIRAYGSDYGWTGPPDGANWQVINGIDLK